MTGGGDNRGGYGGGRGGRQWDGQESRHGYGQRDGHKGGVGVGRF